MSIHARHPKAGTVDIITEGRELGAVLSDVYSFQFQLLLDLKALVQELVDEKDWRKYRENPWGEMKHE